MKSISVSLSFAILSFLAVASCKNDTVDPATSTTTVNTSTFVGVYESQATLSYGRTGAIAIERPQSATLTVSRSTAPNGSNQLIFHEQYLGTSRDYSVYLDGNAFTVDKNQEQVSVEGNLISGVMSGIGKFSTDGKTVSLYTSTDVIAAGPYNRSVKIEGTKK